jgi:hypothetical protein
MYRLCAAACRLSGSCQLLQQLIVHVALRQLQVSAERDDVW